MSDISRILIETIVRKTIYDIKDSPKRSVRNLIDLGLNFAKGRFQLHFLEAAQTMLKNEKSSYYDLVTDTVYNVDSEKLITMGMNIGYNSCTKGAKQIRMIEDSEKYNIPWSLTMEIDEKVFAEKEELYLSFVSQAKKLGIYTYFIIGGTKAALLLAEKFTDCAFIVFCTKKDITTAFEDEAQKLNNLMPVIRLEEDIAGTLSRLREKKMLYSIYIPYTDEAVESITTGEAFDEIESLHPAFVGMLPLLECSEKAKARVYQYVIDVRNNQTMQTILWDVFSDNNFIDSIISEDACSAFFDINGNLISPCENKRYEECNLFVSDVADIFKSAFPK